MAACSYEIPPAREENITDHIQKHTRTPSPRLSQVETTFSASSSSVSTTHTQVESPNSTLSVLRFVHHLVLNFCMLISHHITVTGGGSGTPGPLVSIPGFIKGDEPGYVVNIYSNFNNYTVPGPAVWAGQSSGGGSSPPPATTAKPATTSKVRDLLSAAEGYN